jgi:hypothetical protein
MLGCVVVSVYLIGCDWQPSPGDAAIPAAQQTMRPKATQEEESPLIDYPEYVSWTPFPVGLVVVRQKVVTNDSEAVHVTTTLRLIEKSADKIVVESQVTVNRPGQPALENAPFRSEYRARFRLPAGMRAEQFDLPALKARQIGEETVESCGQEYSTQVFIWDEINETGPMHVKLWRSEAMPGRMVRQEIHGPMHTSVEDVVEITLPQRANEP